MNDATILVVDDIVKRFQTPDGAITAVEQVSFSVAPGETKTIRFKADRPGVWPFYCTNFCSAMHQEMQGYLLVKPAGAGGAAAAK